MTRRQGRERQSSCVPDSVCSDSLKRKKEGKKVRKFEIWVRNEPVGYSLVWMFLILSYTEMYTDWNNKHSAPLGKLTFSLFNASLPHHQVVNLTTLWLTLLLGSSHPACLFDFIPHRVPACVNDTIAAETHTGTIAILSINRKSGALFHCPCWLLQNKWKK